MTPFNPRDTTVGPLEPADAIARPAMERVRSEYREMPGLALTAGQAHRLFGIPAPVCERALDQLVQDGFLHVRRGTYRRTGQS